MINNVREMFTRHGGLKLFETAPGTLVCRFPGFPSRTVIVDVLPDGFKTLDDFNNYLALCRFTYSSGAERAIVRKAEDITRLEARLFGAPPAGKVIPFRQKGGDGRG